MPSERIQSECALCGMRIERDPLPLSHGGKFVHPNDPECKGAMQTEIQRLRAALEYIHRRGYTGAEYIALLALRGEPIE